MYQVVDPLFRFNRSGASQGKGQLGRGGADFPNSEEFILRNIRGSSITHMLHVWYIYLPKLGDFGRANVGKYM
jgi:hypothetical protein